MTIAKHFLGKKLNKQQQEPLVPCEKIVSSVARDDVHSGQPTVKDVEEGKPVVVTMHAHVRRVSSITTLCVFLISLLVCTTGIIGGVYLYKQFNSKAYFHGWCSIPLPTGNHGTPKHDSLQGDRPDPIIVSNKAWEMVDQKNMPEFDESFEIDVKFQKYERIDVPPFAHGRKATFVHDFTVNKTAIADYENHRCFLMILDQRFVWTPRRLFDLVSRLRAGFYEVDTEFYRQNMRIVLPRITDLQNVGIIIARDCASMPIYKLERMTSPVYKRSVDDINPDQVYAEFAGSKITQYNIVNTNVIPPEDHS